MYFPCSQYGEAIIKDLTVSTALSDSCVKVGMHICLIQNIIRCETGVYIVYKKFLSQGALFQYPLDSSKIDIHEVSNIGPDLHTVNIEAIIGKYVLLPTGRGYAALPVIHTH